MREQPWNIRRASTAHYSRYRDLCDIHAITLGWIGDLNVERPPHLLQRGSSQQVSETLWMLEHLAASSQTPERGKSLDTLLDDTSPEDVLSRLEATVHAAQAWTLSAILEQTAESELPSVLGQLEQSSWKKGRDCATARWPTLEPEARESLLGVLASYRNSPFAWKEGQPALLVKRATHTGLQIQLLSCPHLSPLAEVRLVADRLCALQAHWVRGFAYALNTRILVDHRQGITGRCQQLWSFS